MATIRQTAQWREVPEETMMIACGAILERLGHPGVNTSAMTKGHASICIDFWKNAEPRSKKAADQHGINVAGGQGELF